MTGRGSVGVALALAAASLCACFRGDFLENTCEQLASCGDSIATGSSSGSSSTTGAASTSTDPTGGSGSSGATRVELPYIAMRIDSLSFADPNLYASFLDGGVCTNVRTTLNGLVTGEIASGDTNIIIAATNYQPDTAQFNFIIYQNPTCDLALSECTISPTELPPPFPALNIDAGECISLDTATMNPANLPELIVPGAPCFRTPAGSFSLKVSDSLGFIALTQFRMAASYLPDDQDPSEGLGSGIIHGFIRQEDAEMINYDLMGMPINLWSLIAGSGHPDECATKKGVASDVDLIDLTGPMGEPDGVPETPGIWVFINFTAERVRLFADL